MSVLNGELLVLDELSEVDCFELTEQGSNALSYSNLRQGILGTIITAKGFAAMDEPAQYVAEHFSIEREFDDYMAKKIDWNGRPITS